MLRSNSKQYGKQWCAFHTNTIFHRASVDSFVCFTQSTSVSVQLGTLSAVIAILHLPVVCCAYFFFFLLYFYFIKFIKLYIITGLYFQSKKTALLQIMHPTSLVLVPPVWMRKYLQTSMLNTESLKLKNMIEATTVGSECILYCS